MRNCLELDSNESEGVDDFRIDTVEGESLWLRNGTQVEGTLYAKNQDAVNKAIGKLGISNHVQYYS